MVRQRNTEDSIDSGGKEFWNSFPLFAFLGWVAATLSYAAGEMDGEKREHHRLIGQYEQQEKNPSG